MRTRPFLPAVMAVALLAAACGSDDDLGSTGSGADPAGPSTTLAVVAPRGDDVGSDGTGEPADPGGDEPDASGGGAGGGWLDGAPPSGEGADGATDMDDGRDIAVDAAGAAPEFDPPVDPTPIEQPLRAGSVDDAADVPAFLDYRNSILDAGVEVRPLDVTDSTLITVVGADGRPVLGADVEIRDPARGDAPVRTLRTRADGTARFLPHALDQVADRVTVSAVVGDTATAPAELTIGTPRLVVEIDAAGGHDGPVPLDILFVLDATGSMGDEIARLRSNMTSVARQIDELPSAPDVRFGMTVYRDVGDDYVTRTFDLTDDLGAFLDALDQVVAAGGGDYAEAMDEALADALERPSWRDDDAVQLVFLVADAPPQVARTVPVPYTESARTAAAAGVKIFPIAASGTDDQAEFVMRELAFVTGGRFVFLAYGGGDTATGTGTDITEQDFDELPLDQLVVRLVVDELAALAGDGVDPGPTTTTTPPPSTTVPAPDQ